MAMFFLAGIALFIVIYVIAYYFGRGLSKAGFDGQIKMWLQKAAYLDNEIHEVHVNEFERLDRTIDVVLNFQLAYWLIWTPKKYGAVTANFYPIITRITFDLGERVMLVSSIKTENFGTQKFNHNIFAFGQIINRKVGTAVLIDGGEAISFLRIDCQNESGPEIIMAMPFKNDVDAEKASEVFGAIIGGNYQKGENENVVFYQFTVSLDSRFEYDPPYKKEILGLCEK